MAFSFTETVTPTRTKDERIFKDLGTRVARQTLAKAAREKTRT